MHDGEKSDNGSFVFLNVIQLFKSLIYHVVV